MCIEPSGETLGICSTNKIWNAIVYPNELCPVSARFFRFVLLIDYLSHGLIPHCEYLTILIVPDYVKPG
jgi:hypothetical protein